MPRHCAIKHGTITISIARRHVTIGTTAIIPRARVIGIETTIVIVAVETMIDMPDLGHMNETEIEIVTVIVTGTVIVEHPERTHGFRRPIETTTITVGPAVTTTIGRTRETINVVDSMIAVDSMIEAIVTRDEEVAEAVDIRTNPTKDGVVGTSNGNRIPISAMISVAVVVVAAAAAARVVLIRIEINSTAIGDHSMITNEAVDLDKISITSLVDGNSINTIVIHSKALVETLRRIVAISLNTMIGRASDPG